MKLKYIGYAEEYTVTLSAVASNVVQVVGESLVMRETGFVIIDGENQYDYSAFSTLYRTIENGVFQYSNDGSTYSEPTKTVTVSIIWEDDEDAISVRPANVKVTVVDGAQSIGTVTLNAKNGWSKDYTNVPESHEYSVGAPDIERYDKEIDGTTITYKLQPPYEPSIYEQLAELTDMIIALDERVYALEEGRN